MCMGVCVHVCANEFAVALTKFVERMPSAARATRTMTGGNV